MQDTFSVHIRGVGQWTNKLYDHFKNEKADDGNNVVPELAGKLSGRLQSLDIFVDGPFGSPSSNIYRAEHAVLVGTGIGVTPFASILQSITQRYKQVKQKCPSCEHQWSDNLDSVMGNLKKVHTPYIPISIPPIQIPFRTLYIWMLLQCSFTVFRLTSFGSTGTRKVLNGLFS